jgi:NADPH2:quinone reductase
VGTVTGQLARHWGLRPLLGTVSGAAKAGVARGYGYGQVFGYTDFAEGVLAATAGRGVDVVLDPVGGQVRAASFELLAPFGRLVTYSNISREPEVVPDAAWMRARCVGYLGFSGGQLPLRDPASVRPSLQEAAGLVSSGAVEVRVTEVYPLDQAARAHQVFERRAAVGKFILAV